MWRTKGRQAYVITTDLHFDRNVHAIVTTSGEKVLGSKIANTPSVGKANKTEPDNNLHPHLRVEFSKMLEGSLSHYAAPNETTDDER